MNAFSGANIFSILLAILLIQATTVHCQEGLDDILSDFDEAPASDNMSLDDTLSGFEDEEPLFQKEKDSKSLNNTEAASLYLPEWIDVSGNISFGTSFNFAHKPPVTGQTDYQDFSRLRTTLDLNTDFKLPQNWQAKISGHAFYDSIYSLKRRSQYSDAVLDEYEDEVELGEVYLQGSLSTNLDLKIGRQVVAWGKSDNIRVTDILNPLDNREPGVIDIKDIRLPVTMTKVDYYNGKWNLSSIVVHEFRSNKEPVFGNDFFQGNTPSSLAEKPNIAIDNQEYALALNGIFSGWDVSFYGAWLWNDQSHLENTPEGKRRRHNRISMLGSSINIANGNWLLKGETAYFDGLEFSIDVGTKQRLDTLIGAEYSGFNESTVSLEVVNRHIFSFDDRLKQSPVFGQENEFQSVLRVNRDFFNDTLQLTLLLSIFDLKGEDGSFHRLSVKYDWSDSVQVTAGVICYQNGNNAMFRSIDDNDRIFSKVQFSF